MKIAIDGRSAVTNRRGIGKYALYIITYLLKIDRENEYTIFTSQEDIEGVMPNAANLKVEVIRSSNFFLWEQVLLPKRLKNDDFDILHCLGNTAPVFLTSKTMRVVTLHDVMFLKRDLKLRSPYQILGKYYRSVIVKAIYRLETHFITVSEFSKKDIIETLGKPIYDVKAILECCDEDFLKENTQLSNLHTKPYILALGAEDPRKNTTRTIKVFFKLIELGYKGNFVIVGYKNAYKSKVYKTIIESPHADRFIFKDFVADEELISLYKFADLFLYLSIYEGFGMPPLEAMGSGCPVITSNTTSIPEIAGDGAILVSPTDDEEIIKACVSLIESNDLKRQYIEKGYARVKEFSWEKTARQTLNFYKELFQ